MEVTSTNNSIYSSVSTSQTATTTQNASSSFDTLVNNQAQETISPSKMARTPKIVEFLDRYNKFSTLSQTDEKIFREILSDNKLTKEEADSLSFEQVERISTLLTLSNCSTEEEWKNAGFTWDILEKICEYFYKHRTFYSKVLQIEGQNSFTEHFRDILVPVNRKFLAMVEEEEKGEHDEFYIHFFSDAFLAALVRWLEDRECVSPQEFSALLRSSVEMIAKYVLQSQK